MVSKLRHFSVFYFCYYAALGAYTPYIGRWVASMGHSGYVVGSMLGLWYGSRIISPPLWSALMQRSDRPGNWFIAGSLLTVLCFTGFLFTSNAIALLSVMAIFGLFYNAIMPQFEAMTLTALGSHSHLYGKIRVWGSVGFLIIAASFGWVLDRLGDKAFPWITLPLLAAMALSAWPHRHDRRPEPAATLDEAGHLWKRPGVRRFLLVALLVQMGFGAFYVFYTLHLKVHGHSGAEIGALWGLGVLIEIAMFWHAPRVIARYGADAMMGFCIAITVLRWFLTGMFADSLAIMAFAQLFHAFSFAIYHACCMRRMTELFPGHRAADGQSLLYGFSSGVGGVLGAIISALAWEWSGGKAAFVAGASVTAIAWFVWRWRPKSAAR